MSGEEEVPALEEDLGKKDILGSYEKYNPKQ